MCFNFRKPQNTKAKPYLQDSYLVLIVLGLVIVDIVILVIYVIVEGLMTHFSAGKQPNEEKLRATHGVNLHNV